MLSPCNSDDAVDYSNYVSSLPKYFETVQSWTTDKIRCSLKGTSLGRAALTNRLNESTRKMYHTRLLPAITVLRQFSLGESVHLHPWFPLPRRHPPPLKTIVLLPRFLPSPLRQFTEPLLLFFGK